MAEKDLDKALDLKLQGNEKFKAKDFEGAIDLYTQSIQLCPPHRRSELSIIYQNRAAANERLESLEAARTDLNSSLDLNNRYGKALERRAKIVRRLAAGLGGSDEKIAAKIADLKQAMEDITMSSILDGYKQDHLAFVDGLLKELGSAEAVLAAKSREPTLPSHHSIVQYFTSFTQDPFMEEVIGDSPYAQAKAAYLSGSHHKIIEHCQAEIDQALPNTLQAKLVKATFLILSKQLTIALKLLSEIIEEAGDNKTVQVNALIKRGALHIQKCQDPIKDAELSIADFDQAESIDPDNADIFMNRGQVKLLLDKFEEAVNDLNTACKINPEFALAHVQKLYTDFLSAQMAGDAKKIDEVVGNFEKALEKFPDCVETYALFAKVLQEKYDFERADLMFQKGSELNPQNGNLVIHRALLGLQRTGDVESALKEINRAIQIDDKNEFAYETLGQIELQRDNLEEAVKLFDKAIPLVNTELEMAHLFGLRDSAAAKLNAKQKLSEVPSGMQDLGLD